VAIAYGSLDGSESRVRLYRPPLEFGNESLAVTQDYLADVRRPGQAKKAVADADFIPTPQVVETGTNGD
jgi:hypothetical protein